MRYRPAWETGLTIHFKGLALGGYFHIPNAEATSRLQYAGWLPHRHVEGAWVPGTEPEEIAAPLGPDRWIIAQRFRRWPDVDYVSRLGLDTFGAVPDEYAVRAPGFRLPVSVQPGLYGCESEPQRSVRLYPEQNAPPLMAVVAGVPCELCLRAVRDRKRTSYSCDIEIAGPRYIKARRRSRRATYLGDYVRPFSADGSDELIAAMCISALYRFALDLTGVTPRPGRPGNLNEAAKVVWTHQYAAFLTELPGPIGPRRFTAFGMDPWFVPVTERGVGASILEASDLMMRVA